MLCLAAVLLAAAAAAAALLFGLTDLDIGPSMLIDLISRCRSSSEMPAAGGIRIDCTLAGVELSEGSKMSISIWLLAEVLLLVLFGGGCWGGVGSWTVSVVEVLSCFVGGRC